MTLNISGRLYVIFYKNSLVVITILFIFPAEAAHIFWGLKKEDSHRRPATHTICDLYKSSQWNGKCPEDQGIHGSGGIQPGDEPQERYFYR